MRNGFKDGWLQNGLLKILDICLALRKFLFQYLLSYLNKGDAYEKNFVENNDIIPLIHTILIIFIAR